jgi:hypothetical protein
VAIDLLYKTSQNDRDFAPACCATTFANTRFAAFSPLQAESSVIFAATASNKDSGS